MEATAFAIGLGGIFAIVDKSFSIWQSISETKHFGVDMTALIAKLSMECYRFHNWVEVSGVCVEESATTHLSPTRGGLMANAILDAAAQFLKILEDIVRIFDKYKPSSADVADSGELSATTLTLSSRLPVPARYAGRSDSSAVESRIVQQGTFASSIQHKTSFRRRVLFASKPWGRPDREELKNKIDELCYWNDRLGELLPKGVSASLSSQAPLSQILIDENKQALPRLTEESVESSLGEEFQVHARLWAERNDISSHTSSKNGIDGNRLISAYRRDITCLESVSTTDMSSSVSSQLALRVYMDRPGSQPSRNGKTRGPDRVFGTITADKSNLIIAPSLAVVEWYSYLSTKSEDLRIASTRLAGLVRLTSKDGLPNSLRILKGVGFVESGTSLGMIYAIPPSAHPMKQPVSLFSLMTNEAPPDFRRPPLEARLHLAHQLTSALHSFGLVRWYHKDFNCRNIVFFRSKESSSDKLMWESPYITGFSISRPDAQDEVSLNKDHEELSIYLHPDLRTRDPKTRPKYERKYDIYSLGLVLLEIGFWQTLSSLERDSSNLSPVDFKARIIRRCQKSLAFFTGSTYRDTVLRCLKWADEDFDEAANSLESFYFMVVLELVKLADTSKS